MTPTPIDMQVGARIAYRLRLWGIPVRWFTVIEEWSPSSCFVDVQVKGPYRRWRHLHRFESAADGGTLMTDVVELELPFGVVGALAYYLFVRRSLARIFAHRAAVLERLAQFPAFQEPS